MMSAAATENAAAIAIPLRVAYVLNSRVFSYQPLASVGQCGATNLEDTEEA